MVHSLKTMSLKTIHYSQVFSSLIMIFYDDLRKLPITFEIARWYKGESHRIYGMNDFVK